MTTLAMLMSDPYCFALVVALYLLARFGVIFSRSRI